MFLLGVGDCIGQLQNNKIFQAQSFSLFFLSHAMVRATRGFQQVVKVKNSGKEIVKNTFGNISSFPVFQVPRHIGTVKSSMLICYPALLKCKCPSTSFPFLTLMLQISSSIHCFFSCSQSKLSCSRFTSLLFIQRS